MVGVRRKATQTHTRIYVSDKIKLERYAKKKRLGSQAEALRHILRRFFR